MKPPCTTTGLQCHCYTLSRSLICTVFLARFSVKWHNILFMNKIPGKTSAGFHEVIIRLWWHLTDFFVKCKTTVHMSLSDHANQWTHSPVVVCRDFVLPRPCVQILLDAIFFACKLFLLATASSLWETALTCDEKPQPHLGLTSAGPMLT